MQRFAIFPMVRQVVLVVISAALYAQSSPPTASSPGGGMQKQFSPGQTSQFQTSAQNPVFGSVPDAKATAGVLRLTFSDAIERALDGDEAEAC